MLDTHAAEIAKLQEQLAAKSAEMLQLSARYGKLTDNLSREKPQNAAGATALDGLKTATGISGGSSKRAWVARQCKASSATHLRRCSLLCLLNKRTQRFAVKR